MPTPSRSFEPFWEAAEADIPAQVWARQKSLEDQAAEMRADNLMYMSIATNGNVDGSGSYGSESSQYRLMGMRVRKNITGALIDTAASRIASLRTLPVYTAAGADYTLRQKAEDRANCLLHQMTTELNVFKIGPKVWYDAARCGSGAARVFVNPDTGRPKVVRLKPNSYFTDQAEGDNPRTLTIVYFTPRDYLARQYKDHAAKIADATGPTFDDYETFFIRQDNEADLVKVVEAWHLPSGGDASDGMHVMTTNNAVLHKAPYTRQRYPVVFYNLFDRPFGFWGQGYVERALSAQVRYWQLQTVIDRCENLGSNLVFLVHDESDVQAGDIDNMPGLVLKYGGPVPPQAVVWSGTPQDLVRQQQQIWADLLEQEGFSPGTVNGELPQKGLNSARAVRAATDVSSQRHVPQIKNFEDFYKELVQCIADANDDCVALKPQYTVSSLALAGRSQFMRTSKWAELAIPEGDIRLNVFSVNAMASSPAAQLEAIEELTQQGAMTRAQAMALIGVPDLPAWAQLETAQEDLVQFQIEKMRAGTRELPIPNQVPYMQEAKRAVNNALLIAYRSGAPEETQQLFRNYIAYWDVLQAQQPTPVAEEPLPPEQAPAAPLAA